MSKRSAAAVLLAALAVVCLQASSASAGIANPCTGNLQKDNPANSVVHFVTSLGSVCVEIFEQRAPVNAANLLGYVERGDFDNTFVHRGAPGFVIQAGGYTAGADSVVRTIPRLSEVIDELCTPPQGSSECDERGNVRGTLAMAKSSAPNSANSEFFFNLVDNRTELDVNNGGFTVVGKVIGDGMQVVDMIAALPRQADPYATLPFSLRVELQSHFMALGELPLRQLPTPAPGGYGCFDPSQAVLLYRAVNKQTQMAPASALIYGDETWDGATRWPQWASGACGTQLETLSDFKAEDSTNPLCQDKDRYGESSEWCPEAQGQMLPICFGPNPPYRLTCDQVQASIASLEDRYDDLGPKHLEQLVWIESATNLPEPGLATGGFAALLLLVLRRGSQRARVSRLPGSRVR